MYASNKKMLLEVNSSPKMKSTPACLRLILKLCLVSRRKNPKITTAKEYLKNRIDSIAAPLFISGMAKSGLRPYVIPVIIPAG